MELFDYKFIVAVVAAILVVVGYYPYFNDIAKKKTTPHSYTWLIWAITQGTATVALIYGGGNFGAFSLIMGTILVVAVFILSLKFGTKNITRSDSVLLVLAIVAIILWWILHNPVLAVLIVTIIDAIGYIPTLRKSFHEPWSETLIFWATMFIINLLTIAALQEYNFLTVTYSVMLAIGNGAVWMMCVWRRKSIPKPIEGHA